MRNRKGQVSDSERAPQLPVDTTVEKSLVEQDRLEQAGSTKLQRLLFKVFQALSKHVLLYSLLFYVLGVVWVGLFPLVCITTGEMKCRGTYFSENALNAGAAKAFFTGNHINRNTQMKLEERMVVAGLQEVGWFDEALVYGIVRPNSGSDRREAVILVAKMHDELGIAVGLGLVDILSEAEWLSKNVLFVVSNDEESLSRWVHSYHALNSNLTRGGAIIGGLVFDLTSERVSSINVLAPGFNGQLPNLDLVNVVVHLLRHIPLRTSLTKDRSHGELNLNEYIHSKDPQVVQYLGRLEEMLWFMQNTAFGPTGWHAHLLPYNIHAVTIAFGTSGGMRELDRDPHAASYVGRVAEQTIRSLSNLEEKFHQSYFLYVLPDIGLFVSIGEYAGSLGLVLSPLMLSALKFFTLEKDNGDTVYHGWYGFGLIVFSVAMGTIAMETRHFFPIALVNLLVNYYVLTYRTERVDSLCASTKCFAVLLFVIVHGMIGMVNYPLSILFSCILVPFYALFHRPKSVILGKPLLIALFSLTNYTLYLVLHTNYHHDVIEMYELYHVFIYPYLCIIHYPCMILSLSIILA